MYLIKSISAVTKYNSSSCLISSDQRVCLVRVRNPWGDKNEWRGSWSDGDQSWEMVSNHTKREMGLHYMHDGEFWIEFFTDFCREFEVKTI